MSQTKLMILSKLAKKFVQVPSRVHVPQAEQLAGGVRGRHVDDGEARRENEVEDDEKREKKKQSRRGSRQDVVSSGAEGPWVRFDEEGAMPLSQVDREASGPAVAARNAGEERRQ